MPETNTDPRHVVMFDAVTDSGKSVSCEITFCRVHGEPGSAGIVDGYEFDSAVFTHKDGSVELTEAETDELIERARGLL